MLITIDIDDKDWLVVSSKMKNIDDWFTVNMFSDSERESISRLIRLHVVSQIPYHGEQVCYHLQYALTSIGRIVWEKWKERSSKPSEQKLYRVRVHIHGYEAAFYVRAQDNRQACRFVLDSGVVKEAYTSFVKHTVDDGFIETRAKAIAVPVDDSPGVVLGG